MRISYVLLGLVIIAAVSCTSNERETPSGLKFEVLKAGDNVLPAPGEYVVFNFTFKDSNDSTWDETYSNGMPAAMMIQDSASIQNEDGLTQMLRMLSKGDSVKTSIPIKDFFKDFVRAAVPPDMDSTLTLYYYFNVVDVMSMMDYRTFAEAERVKFEEKQLGRDTVKIDQYLADNNMTAQRTASGIRYVITQEGEGENATSGQSLDVNYVGYSLDGIYFDTSIQEIAEEKGILVPGRPYAPYNVVIDQTQVIRGWHDALKYMNKGSKATVFIPSTLAYGNRPLNEKIGKNSVLVFDLEVVDLKENE